MAGGSESVTVYLRLVHRAPRSFSFSRVGSLHIPGLELKLNVWHSIYELT